MKDPAATMREREMKEGTRKLTEAEFAHIWTLACRLLQDRNGRISAQEMREALRGALGLYLSTISSLAEEPMVWGYPHVGEEGGEGKLFAAFDEDSGRWRFFVEEAHTH